MDAQYNKNKNARTTDSLDELVAAIKKTENIPTLPKVLTKLTEEMNSENYSIKNIGDMMSHDVSLSARILKIVNSPFYGFPQRIHSINHAIVLLGANVLKSIVISTSAFTLMKEAMEGLWEHSLFCAFAAKEIALNINKRDKKSARIDPDMMFSAGLLHDIGKIIIATTFKTEFKQILEISEKDKRPLTKIEHEMLHISHDQLSYMLTKEWNLPSSICIPIKYHHDVNLADDFKIETAILNLADFLTQAIGIGYSKNVLIEPLNKDSMNILNIDIDFIRHIIGEIYSFKDELYIFD